MEQKEPQLFPLNPEQKAQMERELSEKVAKYAEIEDQKKAADAGFNEQMRVGTAGNVNTGRSKTIHLLFH
jgi:hypothetical protein